MSVLMRVAVVGALLSLLVAANASAATRNWDGGCGVDTKWSCAANWSENMVPTAADTAVFTSVSGNSTVDAGFAGEVAILKLEPGYPGTVSLARSLTVSSTLSQGGGTFTAGSQALKSKALILSGGTFTASSGTTSISGALSILGAATFNANGGAVAFTGISGAMLTCSEAEFNDVVFTHTAGTKTVGPSCSLPLGEDPKAGSGGSISLKGTLTGTGTLTTTGTLTLAPGGGLPGFSGLVAKNLTITGSYDFDGYAPFAVGGNFGLKSGASLTAPSGTAEFARSFSVSSGATFNANEGTLSFPNKTSAVLACGGKTFYLVSFEGSTARKTIGGDCTLPLGANPSLGKGGTVLKGTLSGSGNLDHTGTFEIYGASPGLDSFANVADTGSFIVKSGAALKAPGGTLTVNGNFAIESGAGFDANEGTVNFQALPKTTKTITCGEAEFNLVEFTNTSKQVVGGDCTLPLGSEPEIGNGGQIVVNGTLQGSGKLTAKSLLLTLGSTGSLSGFSGLSSGALLVEGAYDFGAFTSFSASGDFSIAATGEFTAPEGTAKFAGDFVNGGSFDANEGTVQLIGIAQALGGSTTFNDLTKVAANADTLTFPTGATQTVEGTLILEGASAEKLLSLVSSSPGTQWILAGAGSRTAKWLSVQDSNNTGAAITAAESSDGGNNAGWTF
jgi:hypothetical protein